MDVRMNTQNMKLYWWEGFYGFHNIAQRFLRGKNPYVKNFGDLLSPLIASLLTGKAPKHSIQSGKLLGLGSILFALSDNDTVWGSGFLNAKHIQYALACKNVNYLAVRGPLTQKLLFQHGIACPEIYGDPAILLPKLIKNDIPKKYTMSIVPHFSQYSYFQKNLPNVKIINVENNVTHVVSEILSSEIILSSSLHGLIIAEAYDIPALLLVVDKPLHGDLFKYEDYFHATDRGLFYEEFQTDKINLYADLAVKQCKPIFNSDRLLATFPFPTNFSSDLSWSEMRNLNYKHSIIPPKWSVV